MVQPSGEENVAVPRQMPLNEEILAKPVATIDLSDEISKANSRIDLLVEALQTERGHRAALQEGIARCRQQTEAVQTKLSVEQAARESEVGMLVRDLNSLWLALATGSADDLGKSQAKEHFEKACAQVDICRKIESDAKEREGKLDLVAGELVKMGNSLQSHFVEVLERVDELRGDTSKRLTEFDSKLKDRCDSCRQIADKAVEDAARCHAELRKIVTDVQGMQLAQQAGRASAAALPARAANSPPPPQDRRLEEATISAASNGCCSSFRQQPTQPQDHIVGSPSGQLSASQASQPVSGPQLSSSTQSMSQSHRHAGQRLQQQAAQQAQLIPQAVGASTSSPSPSWMRNFTGRELSTDHHESAAAPMDRSPTSGGQPKNRSMRAGNSALSPIASRAEVYLQGSNSSPPSEVIGQEVRVRDRRAGTNTATGTSGSNRNKAVEPSVCAAPPPSSSAGTNRSKAVEPACAAPPPSSAGGLRPCRSTSPLEVGASVVSLTATGASGTTSHGVQAVRRAPQGSNMVHSTQLSATTGGFAATATAAKPTSFQCNPRSTI
mmetsp:Transcript_60109/g.143241  ORF Transcript_60109/g.143241 Transcript_60109/m.143241 type:complete len:553 (+) Transcript_60109:83-1741(+)|eukprot:CAMPEP_0178401818 /NCGR_PEP_ID=MMETSP0689_2-20121128/16503_1 /TAXON_ID=160604 /ORGANISM="Amphidinium massartii, Strain CS-259" /LENGTH=552 /DNA_ID=CAMNT_0020022661 /DNA_START=83 /DNA_END=1741 /DNA_ORIENTATION=-